MGESRARRIMATALQANPATPLVYHDCLVVCTATSLPLNSPRQLRMTDLGGVATLPGLPTSRVPVVTAGHRRSTMSTSVRAGLHRQSAERTTMAAPT